MSPVLRSTEHDVWMHTSWPLMLKQLLESKRLDVTVNVCPFATCVKKPSSETDADGGKVEVRAPDALSPWLLKFRPWPAVYRKVSEVGRFLLSFEQMVHCCCTGGDGGNGGLGGVQVTPPHATGL
jgi:hypothetical protein